MLKIKSKYIIKRIFDNIQQKKYLNLIKYNKKIQKILDASIRDYKNYLQIEIELKPKRFYRNEDKFVNLDDKSYVNIYFNNHKRRNKTFYLEVRSIKTIKIVIDYEIKTLKGLFKNCEYIKEINFIKFNRKDISDISEMFYGCKNLDNLNLLNFKTDRVTNMSYLFYGCSSLKSLNLSNFNTSNVINIQNMFEDCSNLEKLNLCNFKTEKVVYMNDMFYECKSLKKINIYVL